MQELSSKKARRLQVILSTLETKSTVRIGELANLLKVSTETIRRDLQELENAGKINRTYGGAVHNTVREPALADRLTVAFEERERIATEALNYLGDADHIFLCGGSTAVHFARALRNNQKRDLIVLTISLSVVDELAHNPLIQVMMLPGIHDAKERIVHGPETLAAIDKYCPPLAIMSASALDSVGLSEALLVYAHNHAAMMKNAEKTLVLMESKKFGRRALTQIATWNPSLHLITNEAPNEQINTALTKAGANCSVVTQNSDQNAS